MCAVEFVDVVTAFVVVAGRFILFAASKSEVRRNVVAMSCGGYRVDYGDRTTVGVVATAVDGGSTLRAAVASRMRNQRQRYDTVRRLPG